MGGKLFFHFFFFLHCPFVIFLVTDCSVVLSYNKHKHTQ
jgi:hypothetical protein